MIIDPVFEILCLVIFRYFYTTCICSIKISFFLSFFIEFYCIEFNPGMFYKYGDSFSFPMDDNSDDWRLDDDVGAMIDDEDEEDGSSSNTAREEISGKEEKSGKQRQ